MPAGALEQFEEDFSLFDSWEDRYRYLIELGGRLKPMDDSLKTPETLVKGCTSQVWLIAEIKDGRFHFTADSDAHIVRAGLPAAGGLSGQDRRRNPRRRHPDVLRSHGTASTPLPQPPQRLLRHGGKNQGPRGGLINS